MVPRLSLIHIWESGMERAEGVFKGFYKDRHGVGKFGGTAGNALYRILGDILLQFPVFSRFNCRFSIHCRDANDLAAELPEMDVVYLDPPYNQHPYGSNLSLIHISIKEIS